MRKDIQIIRSSRKTAAIEINSDMRVLVRVPNRMKKADIERFVNEKSEWIDKHLLMMRERLAQLKSEQIEGYTESEVQELFDNALARIPPRVAEIAERMGVTYRRITIRNQVSRWGSCTAEGNLNFNCLLTLFPDGVTDYVIIHELCHRKHMNHSKDFWSEVEKFCPDYKTHKKWLKDNGGEYIKRMREYR